MNKIKTNKTKQKTHTQYIKHDRYEKFHFIITILIRRCRRRRWLSRCCRQYGTTTTKKIFFIKTKFFHMKIVNYLKINNERNKKKHTKSLSNQHHAFCVTK